ncbi:MAG: hypothetical protein CVU89_16975 [Firmicutes bacterium HGW-Firmicutes-14]|nr:MAG: hypothetical protein CVU89_16975 [Firmicutes bacterium HGW-Firmicutes-14]
MSKISSTYPEPPNRKTRFIPFDSGYLALALVMVILGAVLVYHSGFEVRSDGANYFSYLRSAVFDRDLDFRNEFARFDNAFWDTYKPRETETGHLTNVFSVGPSILWSPFYLLAHLFVVIADFFGIGLDADGFSGPYLLSVNLASLFYSFTGICLVYSLCRKYAGKGPALTASLTLWTASFITYYTVYQPYMSHAVSFFAVTLFIYYWDRTRNSRSLVQWSVLGLLAGLMMLVRWQNGLMMLFPALESIILYYTILGRGDSFLGRINFRAAASLLKKNLVFLVFILVGFFPQMAAWKVIYGGFLTIPQGTGFLRWTEPFFSEIMFSSRHGLLSWTPVVYLSLIGFVLFFNRDRLFAISGITVFLMMTYMNSIVSDWWAGWGFGMRRFDAFILFFALGLAWFFHRLARSFPRAWLSLGLIILLVFSGYNWLLMDMVREMRIHPGGPVAFNQALGFENSKIYKYTGYPFSFPANILFAIEHKISPARYDTLVGGYIDDPYFYGDTVKPAEEEVLLGKGWSEPVAYEGRQCRTVLGSAIVYAPVRTVTDFEMSVSAAGSNGTGSGNDSSTGRGLSVYVNGNEITPAQMSSKTKLSSQWEDYKFIISRKYLVAGINTVKFVTEGKDAQLKIGLIKFKRLQQVTDWK